MENFAVRLKNVSKYYRLYKSPADRLREALNTRGKTFHKKFFALADIELEVPRGKVVGIVGSNGSGKSTLLKLIASVLAPSSGHVEVNGSVAALLELGAGFNPDFTGLENLYFYGSILGLSRSEIEERLGDILAFADIGEFIYQPLKTYSNGMKARLGFAIATEVNPDILIIDEVLAVGDAAFQRKCYARIEHLLRLGKTVFMVSHNRNSIVAMCDYAILLDEGRIVDQGEPKRVISSYEDITNRKSLRDGKTNHQGDGLADIDENPTAEVAPDQPASQSYDYTLISDPVLFKSSDADLISFGIFDETGQKTNILKSGMRYGIIVRFAFGEKLENVAIAFRVRSIDGMVVSWVGYPFENREFFDVNCAGEREFQFEFDCNILHGTYVVDCCAYSIREDDLHVHTGFQNLYLFRVDRVGLKQWGIADLKFSSVSSNL